MDSSFKMKRILSGYLLFVVIFSPVKTYGNNFNYTNFELGSTADIDILYTVGSLSVLENAHLFGSLSSQFDNDWVATLGAGFHAPINGQSDLIGNLIFYNLKSEETDDDWYGDFAFGINVGTRFWIMPMFELNASVGRISYNGGDNDSNLVLGARFHNSQTVSVGINYNSVGLYKQKFFLNVRFEY